MATFSLFPKPFPEWSATQFADLLKTTGIDKLDVVIRDGFQVTPQRIKEELPRYMEALSQAGVQADFAVTSFNAEQLAEDIDLLLLLGDHGIKAFRLDYFRLRKDVRTALKDARRALERLTPLCSLSGVRAVYQVHHRTLVSSASAAYQLVRDLPPDAIGVQLDTGNQRIEGYENWSYAVHLLGKYLHSFGAKDVRLPDQWVECGNGQVDWDGLFEALGEYRFEGTFHLMPFYSDDSTELAEGLKREASFLRKRLPLV